MEDIICPHCGKSVELSEAIIHQLSARVREEESKKLRAEFEKSQAEEQEKRERLLRKEFEEENKEKDKELFELEKKIELQEKEAQAREEKIRNQAMEDASKQSRLEKLELEKKLKDTQDALEDAQRKSKQGSQQLQGEVLELDLEEKLRSTFTSDEFLPVPKGVEGGDLWQKVKFQNKEVGSIIWETKRTKDWRPIWLGKLKDDAAKINASEAIIVSQVLPNDTEGFDRKDGIWITDYEHALSIARYVRFLITTIATVKSSTSHTDEDWSKIRDYMLSDAFQHRMHTHLNAVKNLRDMLVTEQRTSTLRWTRQQKQIDKLDSNILNFYGELKDIVHNLPELDDSDIQLLSPADEDSNETLF